MTWAQNHALVCDNIYGNIGAIIAAPLVWQQVFQELDERERNLTKWETVK
jgi:hypothetical protein